MAWSFLYAQVSSGQRWLFVVLMLVELFSDHRCLNFHFII
jgi:hypothetical protein